MPLIPAHRRQRQEDGPEFDVNLVYRARSKITRAVIQRNPVSKSKTKPNKTKRQNKQTNKKKLLLCLLSAYVLFYFLNQGAKIADTLKNFMKIMSIQELSRIHSEEEEGHICAERRQNWSEVISIKRSDCFMTFACFSNSIIGTKTSGII